jgi:tetratricopeptide (TPR) repeat protein
LTLDGVQKALELFQQAIEKDPAYALAYTGLLDSYTYLNRPVEARKAAAQALELDPTLGEAHASLGFFKFLYDWDFPGAEKGIEASHRTDSQLRSSAPLVRDLPGAHGAARGSDP